MYTCEKCYFPKSCRGMREYVHGHKVKKKVHGRLLREAVVTEGHVSRVTWLQIYHKLLRPALSAKGEARERKEPVLEKEEGVLRHAIHVRRLSMRLYRSKSLPHRRNKDKEKRMLRAVWDRQGENEWKKHVVHPAKSNWRSTFLPYRAGKKTLKGYAPQRTNIVRQTVWFVLGRGERELQTFRDEKEQKRRARSKSVDLDVTCETEWQELIWRWETCDNWACLRVTYIW